MGLKCRHLSHWTLALSALGLSVTATAAAGADDPYDGGWHFSVTPYLWLPVVSGSIDTDTTGRPGPNGQPRRINVSGSVDPDSYLSNLDMAAMLSAEARKGDWSIFTDVVYTDFGDKDTTVKYVTGPDGDLSREISRNARTDISATIWTLAGGYTVVREPTWNLELFAGFRYLTMDSTLKLSVQDERGDYLGAKDVSMDQDEWDGIVGARGRILFPDNRWFMPYYADIGVGSSNWTWQVLAGLGYRFDWGEATFAWRALGYEFDDGDVDITFNGPALGASFHW